MHGFRLTLILLLLAGTVAAGEQAARRPNILLFFADDQGYAEAGCYGLADVPTPNIDSIAAEGARCTDGYVTAPVCSPSRAGLLTGRYQQRFGHEFNPGSSRDAGLPLTEKTIADYLKSAGYATALVGKWHLGRRAEQHPLSRGFDEFYGFLHGAHPYFERTGKGGPRDPILWGREEVSEQEYLTDAFGREAVDFIRRHREQPWFLYLSFNAVHAPLQAKDEDRQAFATIEDPKRRTFAAMLSAMDRAVGRVLAEVERQGQLGNTLIFFISDNGGPTKKTTSSNAPLRGFKGQVYEGGIRVPFLVRWDGRLPAGRVVRQPVSSLDVLPTVLAAAGLEPPATKLDGLDLLPLLTGEGDAALHEALFWRMGNRAAVRWGSFKLVLQDGTASLFDLESDVGEASDVAAENPEVVRRMQELYDRWASGTVEPLWKSDR